MAGLERADLWGEAFVRCRVVGRERGHQGAVRGVHGGEEFRLRVDEDDRVDRAERFRVVERGGRGRVEERDGLQVRAGVLAREEVCVGRRSPVEGDRAPVDGLRHLVGQFLGLRRVDQRAEVQGGEGAAGSATARGCPVRSERTAGR